MSFLSRFLPKTQIPLEQQLEQLATVGVALNPPFTAETLLEEFAREKFEERPYVGAVITMGGYKDGLPLSNNIFHLDTESIKGEGDYAHIAERMRDLAQGDLPIENIHDHFDRGNGDAWVAFELNNPSGESKAERFEWHARVKENWIDPDILTKFCALLKARNTERRYTFFDLKGKDCLIGCATEEQVRELRRMTGMNFAWLE